MQTACELCLYIFSFFEKIEESNRKKVCALQTLTVKNFNLLRELARDLFIYGYKTREDYGKKRSKDEQKQRIVYLLGDYIETETINHEKITRLISDPKNPHNILFTLWQAANAMPIRAFWYFAIIDALSDGRSKSTQELLSYADTLLGYDYDVFLDSENRQYFKHLEEVGIIEKEKVGRELRYALTTQFELDEQIKDAITFFSETAPVGVIGTFMIGEEKDTPYTYLHHFIGQALEDEVKLQFLECIHQRMAVTLKMNNRGNGRFDYFSENTFVPLKIYSSVVDGREYVGGWLVESNRFDCTRLDFVEKIIKTKKFDSQKFIEKRNDIEEIKKKHWNTWFVRGELNHLEVTLLIEENAPYVLRRLEEEKRYGSVEKVTSNTYKFTIDLVDMTAISPWLRTFTGRILDIHCTDQEWLYRFADSQLEIAKMYLEGEEIDGKTI
jgi:hypothetical protein